MNAIVVAIHGIMTGQTDPSWPDRLDAWLFRRDGEIKVLKKEYAAGPFPRWNCFVRNPRLAESLGNEITLLAASRPSPPVFPPTWFVAHSNGAVIALTAIKWLIARGYPVGGVILTGAACSGEVAATGIEGWVRSGKLGNAIAYCSARDRVLPLGWKATEGMTFGDRLRAALWSILAWPYGSLGRTGWLRDGLPFGLSLADAELLNIHTRWFTGGHSCYFSDEQRERTFELIYQDICSTPRLFARATGVRPSPAAEA